VAIVGGLGSIVIRAVTYAPVPPNMFGLGEGSMIGFVRALGLGSLIVTEFASRGPQ
jgi:hypothetical protein